MELLVWCEFEEQYRKASGIARRHYSAEARRTEPVSHLVKVQLYNSIELIDDWRASTGELDGGGDESVGRPCSVSSVARVPLT